MKTAMIVLAIAMRLPASTAAGQTGLPFGESEPHAGGETADQLVRIRVATDVERLGAGGTAYVAVIFEIEPHWHIYWSNAGDNGAPTEISVKTPPGFEVGPTMFPRPQAFEDEMGTSFGYEKETVLFVPVTAPRTLPDGGGRFDLDVVVDFFVCRDRCLIGRTKRSVTLTVANPGPPERPGHVAGSDLIVRYRHRIPTALKETPGFEARLEGPPDTRRLVITGPARGFDRGELFPLETPGVTMRDVSLSFAGDRFRLTADLDVRPRNSLGKRLEVSGVLGLGRSPDDPSYHFALPLE